MPSPLVFIPPLEYLKSTHCLCTSKSSKVQMQHFLLVWFHSHKACISLPVQKKYASHWSLWFCNEQRCFLQLSNTFIVPSLQPLIQFVLLNRQHCCWVVMASDHWASCHTPRHSQTPLLALRATDPVVPWHVVWQPQKAGETWDPREVGDVESLCVSLRQNRQRVQSRAHWAKLIWKCFYPGSVFKNNW